MIDLLLLMFLVLTATAAVFMGDLLAAGIMLSAYSLLMAVVWTNLNAVDVAFTEAAVGAGVTTVLLIAALSRTRRIEGRPVSRRKRLAGLLMVVLTGAVLMYGTLDMPAFGDPEAPAQRHVAPRYIEHSEEEAGVANMVTAVLASYRGYDTLGETTVIFTAGSSVILLIRRRRRKG
jgi:multicomponent Na+:H+ antiporter subunit B